MKKKNILVLCTGNSCRSQMAEGYLRFFAGKKATVYSAGTNPHGVHRKAISVMYEDGIDLRSHTSNHVDEYKDIAFDYIITVCDNAKEQCPYIPGNAIRLHHSFPDPVGATGTVEEIRQEFRTVRNMIKEYCKDFTEKNL